MTATTLDRTSRPGGVRLGGRFVIDPPVVLAPMAGVTNVAFRTLCREQAESPSHPEGTAGADAAANAAAGRAAGAGGKVGPGHGLFVCEMVTSRGIVERDATSLAMLAFADDEPVRSVQVYGVNPRTVGEAVRVLCAEHGVDHVDLNFGCPVPKVTRRGGGAALPWKRELTAQILTAAVRAAEAYDVPVTCKTRIGLDDTHVTYRDAGRIAQDAGCAAIALHGRTAEQFYSGTARWDAIADLVSILDIPVLGNGDIWEASDALAMVRETGCAGVVVGRGCLGRPWLFRDLAAAFAGLPAPALPSLGEVAAMMRRHAVLLSAYAGEGRGCREFRKHVAWYLKGFSVRRPIRAGLAMASSLAEIDGWLAQLEPDQAYPLESLGAPRGRQGTPRRVVLPEGWLDDTDGRCAADRELLAGAELGISGG